MLLYKFYNFYEKSVQGERVVVDNDISGEQYKDLMKTCCKYCKILSLKYRKNVFNTTREKLKKFESVNGPLGRPFIEYYSRGEETVFYDVCEELLFCLLSLADNIFCDWIDGWRANGPDDPTFYREDGTVFLNTITHEGELTLRPREDEDVSHIISNIGWLTHDNDPRSYRAEFRVNYVPNEKTATAVAKEIFKNIKFPYKKRELKHLETFFDKEIGKWVVIFGRRDLTYSICKILIDKENCATEVFYEST